MKKNAIKILFTFGSLSLIVGASVYFLEKEKFFSISDISIEMEDASHFTKSIAFQNLKLDLAEQVAKYRDTSLLKLSAKQAAKNIEALGWVESVHIQKIFPSHLKVSLKAKEYIALFQNEKSEFFPMTADAELLQAIDITKAPDLPLVVLRKSQNEQKLKTLAVQVLQALPKKSYLRADNVLEIGLDGEDLFLLLKKPDLQVLLGSDNLPIKLARVEKVLEYLEDRELQGRVISADFSQKVVVKLRTPR